MTLEKRNFVVRTNLRYFRVARGLSIRHLANMIDIPHSTLASIENGKGTATNNLLEKISSALAINVELLMAEGIEHSIELLIKYLQAIKPLYLASVMYPLSMSLHGPIKERVLLVAHENANPQNEKLYKGICYELGNFYETKDQSKSLFYFKLASSPKSDID